MSAEEHPPVTKNDIVEGLRKLGVKKNDAIIAHSSLKSFGHVDGGADAVVDAMIEAVGPDGLACVPTLSFCYEGEQYFYNPKTTPSRVGKISDTLWRRPEARRSLHPSHSVSGIGSRAEELVEYHSYSSHFHRSSPWGKLADWNAKIVFLGATLGKNTMLHAVEEWAGLPLFNSGRAQIEGPNGEETLVDIWGIPGGDRNFYHTDSKIADLLYAKRLVARGNIGPSTVQIVEAQPMQAAVFRALFTDQPDIYCCMRLGCDFCPERIGLCWQKIHGFVPPHIVAHIDACKRHREETNKGK